MRVAHARFSDLTRGARRRTRDAVAAHARRRSLALFLARRAAARGSRSRSRRRRDERPAGPLPRRARRPRRARLHDAQVPHAEARTPRPGSAPTSARSSSSRTRAEYTTRRPLAAGDAARRAAAALERPARRHVLRRAAPDPAALLRGARRGAAGVLAAARRAARADRLRAGAPRLRDVDGGEARARPRVDRRPLGAALPAHALRRPAGACCASPRAASSTRPTSGRAARPRGRGRAGRGASPRRAIAPSCRSATIAARSASSSSRRSALVGERLLLDRAVVAVVEPRAEAVAAGTRTGRAAARPCPRGPSPRLELVEPRERRLGRVDARLRLLFASSPSSSSPSTRITSGSVSPCTTSVPSTTQNVEEDDQVALAGTARPRRSSAGSPAPRRA